ncbi:MAG: hypothetical protein Q9O62_14065 [Ardenticatenia bacterium]|nr:hypothetical protein [Ardenticatenia bacterium]
MDVVDVGIFPHGEEAGLFQFSTKAHLWYNEAHLPTILLYLAAAFFEVVWLRGSSRDKNANYIDGYPQTRLRITPA